MVDIYLTVFYLAVFYCFVGVRVIWVIVLAGSWIEYITIIIIITGIINIGCCIFGCIDIS